MFNANHKDARIFFIVDSEQVFIILITFLSSSFAEKLEFGAHFKKQNKTKKKSFIKWL